MNYEKEPLHISTSVPNGTYEVTVTVTAHEDITVSYTHLADTVTIPPSTTTSF